MRKYRNFTLGGIQQKIFNLVLVMMLLVMAAYTVVILHQMNDISVLVSEAGDRQKAAITDISGNTMESVVNQSLSSSTQMQAQIADRLFSGTADVVGTLGDYTRMLFEAPENYNLRQVAAPSPSWADGTVQIQLLTEEGVNPDDPAIREKLGLVGNLSDIMRSLFAHAEVDSCYVALPEGVMLLADSHPSSKFVDGRVGNIPIHERDWYRGACETEDGGVYFTDLTTDHYTGAYCVMCAVPVRINGELVAVAGADLFLDNMKASYVNASDGNGGFAFIVNNFGHVVFSPRTEGVFQARGGSEALDLRALGNADLAAFITDAFRGNTDVRLIEADGSRWYMTGAPIGTVGWSVVTMVDKEATDRPTVMMNRQFDSAVTDARAGYTAGISNARTTIFVLLAVVAVLALASALVLAKRIVKPLTVMTERIISLGGEDLQFRMEDTYRTGDEIEVLAESFATLSTRTLEYVDQVRSVTAEKERIGTELSLATSIQASMLPHIFPAFPERPEIDIFAVMDPAKEVGGDFYDYFLVDDDHLCLVIADVSGKGVPAALFMMASKIILQSVAMLGCPPEEILRRTNEAICSNNEMQMFVTVWLGILELSTGKLTAANAGHEIPVLRKPGGPFELYRDKHGFVIGGMEGVKYRSYEIQLEPGSKLFLYTDGVAEATSAEEELFGTGRMIDALNTRPDSTPQQLLHNVRAAVDAFVRDAEQFDDLTMLCLEYKGKKAT